MSVRINRGKGSEWNSNTVKFVSNPGRTSLRLQETCQTSEPERVIFGYGIGQNRVLQTPAQAFVQKLYDYELSLQYAYNPQQAEQVVAERGEFLAGGFVAELREDESVEQLLEEAHTYSLDQYYKCMACGANPENCDIPESTTKNMADIYGEVAQQIDSMLPQEQAQ